jgi:hypothetical protein
MSFREKAAWLMGALMIFVGFDYLKTLVEASRAMGWAAPPAGTLAPYIGLVVVGSIVVQTVLGFLSPKEANAPADEREKPLLDRAGTWSGYVLAAGAIGGLGNYLIHGSGDLLFHFIVASLIASQIAEYAFQILLFRRNG